MHLTVTAQTARYVRHNLTGRVGTTPLRCDVTNGELRRELEAQEVAEAAPDSNESLPEAATEARYPEHSTAGASEHLPGEETHDPSTASDADLIVPDPPMGDGATERDQV